MTTIELSATTPVILKAGWSPVVSFPATPSQDMIDLCTSLGATYEPRDGGWKVPATQGTAQQVWQAVRAAFPDSPCVDEAPEDHLRSLGWTGVIGQEFTKKGTRLVEVFSPAL